MSDDIKQFVSRTGIPIDEDDLKLRDALYNPDQPRDDHGKWTDDGSASSDPSGDDDKFEVDIDESGVSYGDMTHANKQSALASIEHDLQALADAAVDPGNSRYVNTERIRDILKADTQMSPEDRKKAVFRYATDKKGKIIGAAQARRDGNNLEVVGIGALTRAIGRTIIRVMQEEAVKSGLKVILTTAYNIFRGAEGVLHDLQLEDERTMLTPADREYVRMSLRVMEEFERRDAAFNPDQPRDERGRFAPIEGGGSVAVSRESFRRPTLESEEFTDVDRESFDNRGDKEDVLIDTGNNDGNFAKDLAVYYRNDATLVIPGGEAYNDEGWKYSGKLSAKEILEDYYASIGVGLEDEDLDDTVKAFKQVPVKFKTAAFKSDQPRDDHGRWTDDGDMQNEMNVPGPGSDYYKKHPDIGPARTTQLVVDDMSADELVNRVVEVGLGPATTAGEPSRKSGHWGGKDFSTPQKAQVFERELFQTLENRGWERGKQTESLKSIVTRFHQEKHTVFVQRWKHSRNIVEVSAKRKLRTAEFNPDQPRDEHGRWTDSGGFEHTGIEWKQPTNPDTGRPIPIPVKSVEEAIPLILAGKVIELPEPRDVVTLIDRFRQIALDAKAKGEKAPDYDLCNVSVAGSNLFCGDKLRSAEYPDGVPRLAMPQLGGKPEPGSEADKLPRNPWDPSEVDGAAHFIAHLQGIGMKTSTEVMPASKLKASQRELVGPKVAGMILDRTFEPAKNPIFISNDNYVVDGHHRWAAVLGRDAEDNKLGDLMMNVVRVNAPISEVLQIANAWSKKFGIKQNAGVQGKK